MVESTTERPVVERPRRALRAVRGQMPLAETAGHITVVAQDSRQRSATLWLDGRIAREWAGELADRSEAHPVMVAPGQQRRAGRRAHRGDVEAVVSQSVLRHSGQRRGADGAA